MLRGGVLGEGVQTHETEKSRLHLRKRLAEMFYLQSARGSMSVRR